MKRDSKNLYLTSVTMVIFTPRIASNDHDSHYFIKVIKPRVIINPIMLFSLSLYSMVSNFNVWPNFHYKLFLSIIYYYNYYYYYFKGKHLVKPIIKKILSLQYI